jgi:hypothetical protein
MFAPTLVPYLDHPNLQNIDNNQRTQILTRHLYQYLNFTANLEAAIVNRGVQRIALNSLPVNVNRRTRLDALKIYTDEGYHALFSLDMINQIEKATGIDELPYDFESYLRNLDSATDALLPNNGTLGQLLQVVIFETAVSSILSDLPTDPNLVTVVSDMVGDHAKDEKIHHAFFVRLFPELWASLEPGQKRQVSYALPRMITEEIKPHAEPIGMTLIAAGFSASEAAAILHDTYTKQQAREYAKHVARYTVKLFVRTGVLDVPGAAEAFAEEGLLPWPPA